jgi:hypothetical protein
MTLSKISFGKPFFQSVQLNDGEFLTRVSWANSASPVLIRTAAQGDVAAFCSALRKHALGTSRGGGAKKVSSKRKAEKPSLWSKTAFQSTEQTLALIDFWDSFGTKLSRPVVKGNSQSGNAQGRSGKKHTQQQAGLCQMLQTLESGDCSDPLVLLVLMEMLHRAGSELPDELLFGLWRKTLILAVTLSTNLDEPVGSDAPEDQRLLILGELPWAAGLLFADVKGAARLANSGNRFLRKELLGQTDSDGTPNAELLERLSLWIAPLVRAAEWSQTFRTKLWDTDSRERFRSLVKIVAPFCRLDGRMALGNGSSHNAASLMSSASRLSGWREKSPPADLLRDVEKIAEKPKTHKRTNGVKRRRVKKSNADYPVTQSDWARVACLRSDWSLHSDTLIVAHHATRPMIDLSVLGESLLSGSWDLEVSLNGELLQLEDEWKCNCWYSDEDADYLELNQKLDDGLLIDRQLLLSRENHFALFADCISNAKTGRIRYVSRLPLVNSVNATANPSTREIALKAGSQKARAFPLALPDDLVISTPGQFGSRGENLELRQEAIGGLYAPVVIDWSPEHRRSYAEWKTLTVSENGSAVKSNSAAGHRLKIGDQQLLLYRRTDRSEEAHTVLGHHTTHETVIGQFDQFGDVDPILLVE